MCTLVRRLSESIGRQNKFILLCGILIVGINASVADKPNMVLFLADDLTYRDIGCYGSPDAITPTIDKLAEEGVLFNKCYQAAPMCSPTRNNLFSGIYPVRSGAYPNHTRVDPWVTQTMPALLKDLGYRVGFMGKGHFGPRQQFPFEYLGDKPKGGDSLDMSLSEKFLKDVAKGDQPFCLVVCSHCPHGPLTLGDPSMFDQDKITVRKNQIDTPQYRDKFVKYLAEINFLDGQVETVLNQLEQNGFSDNTMFLFLGEQGNSFSLSKWTCYEDGVKSACIVRWPGVVKPGTETDALVEYNDIIPTFVEMAGGEVPEELDGKSMLPILKNPKLPGKKYAFSVQTTRGIILGSDYFGIRAVTDGKYRYIWNISPEAAFSNGDTVNTGKNHWFGSWRIKAKDDPEAAEILNKVLNRPEVELYDVDADPDNVNNLADDPKYTKVKAEMKKALVEWMEYCGDKGLETELLAFQHMSNRNPEAPVIGELMEPAKISEGMSKVSFEPGEGFEGFIDIPEDGYYTFHKDKKKRSEIVIIVDGKEIVSADKRVRYGLIGLKKGRHALKIIPDTKNDAGVIKWSGPNRLGKPLETAELYTFN